MKKTIKDSLRRLPGIVATLFLLAAAACMPESFKPGIDTPGSQDRSPMTLEFDFSSSDAGIRTRANEDPMNDNTINSLWVGVFDVETGNLVGTCSKNQNKKNKDTVTVDILYYDAHPTVRIFGVANYEGITGSSERLPGNDLKSLLGQVTTMSQFFSISVDTQSADKRLESGAAPLLMGVYTPDDKDRTGLYTVAADESGEEFEPSENYADITLVTGTYDRFKRLTGGAIRLRRLLSQVNVQVIAGSSDVSLTNIRYRVVNKPKQVYLQERTTQTTAPSGEDKWNEWKVKSPNRADAIDGGYMSDDDFTGPIALPTDPATEPVFSFYQYENKHWGWGEPKTYNEREEVMQSENGSIFTALCGNNGIYSYNNNASYFEIKMDVEVEEDGKTISAKDVTYRIHEGYCNDAAGNRSENNLFDFTCVRNTVYTYKITISGLTSITVDTQTGEHKHTNPGVLGGAEFFTESTTNEPITIDPNIDSEGTSYKFDNVKAAAYICYYANGGSPKYYAGGDEAGIAKLKDLPILPAGFKEAEDGSPDDFGFKFDEESISKIFSPATRADEMNTTTISGTIDTYPNVSNVYPEDYKMSLYLLLASEDLGDDDCVNNTYTYIDALPLDSRQEMGEFDFSLAFANDWDENPDKNNGAVVGHLKKIQVTDLEWKSTAGLPDDLKYTVFLDDELIAGNITTWLFELEKFNSYEANSVHTIKVVAEDPDNKYKPCTIAQKFIVYPTTFTWDYTQISLQASVAQNSYYYGSNFTPEEGASDDIYSGIKHLLSKMTTGTQTNVGNYIQTGGTGNAFEINALYDAVLTIYPSHTGNYWSHLGGTTPSYRYLKVTSSDNSEELSYAAIPKPNAVGDLIPFTFYVKKGQVNIYTGGSLNIYKIELTYIGYPSTPRTNIWSFDETKWTGSIDYIKTKELPFSLSIDGLRLETTNNSISTGTSLIKLDGGGDFDKKERLFSFMAYKSGTVTITAAAAGYDESKTPADHRYLAIKVGETPSESLSILPTTKEKTNQSYSFKISEPTRVYITSGSGGINVYSIKFEESK